MQTRTQNRSPRSPRPPRPRRLTPALRLLGFGALSGLLMFTVACINRSFDNAIPDTHIAWTPALPQSAERDVDILFVVDDSGSMEDEHVRLRANFEELVSTLRQMRGGMPNVHIGVTSTDLGTGNYQIPGCHVVGGKGGALLTGSCANPAGAPYIIDVEPRGCAVERTLDPEAGTLVSCGESDCQPSHCEEPGTTLVVDELGCPRCRNYTGESLETVFGCVSNVGITGCGFEQPLEAMKRALDHHPDNSGFLREGAFLAVLLVTDEDDCSARNPQLFDDSQIAPSTSLGPATSFRCFQFGVECVEAPRTLGAHHQCRSLESASSLLQPVDHYRQFLHTLKDPSMVVVAAIAGPVQDTVTVIPDARVSGWDVDYSCGKTADPDDGARPGIRLREFVGRFNAEEQMATAYTSICDASYAPAMRGLGDRITALLDHCPPTPLLDCADPGVLFGEPGDGRDCNDTCHPKCSVRDVVRDVDGSIAAQAHLPRCLEICNDGPCPGNTDFGRAYAGGHPPQRDPNLPVPACWFVNFNPSCTSSNGAEILVARQGAPAARTFAEVACANVVQKEELCNDHKDNDQDCLEDYEDPDCLELLEARAP